MSLFRKKLIFQVDQSMPDPEDLKVRFRRRVLLLTFLGAVLLLGVPVFRELREGLIAKTELRHLTQSLLDARLTSIRKQEAVLLSVDPKDPHRWQQSLRASCEAESGTTDNLIEGNPAIHWQMHVQNTADNGVHEASTLCFHPLQGLLVDGKPLAEGKLLLSAIPDLESDSKRHSAQALISRYGAEIEFLVE